MNDQTNKEKEGEAMMPSEKSAMHKSERIMISKKNLIAFAIIIVIIALAYFCKGFFIAATVNGSPISRISVIQELEKSSGKQALNTLITRKIITDEARKKGITVSNEEIEAGIKEISDQIAAQGSTLEQVLASQGVTLADFKKNQLIQIEVEKLLGDKITVTDAEVEQYIKNNKINIPEAQMKLAKTQIKSQIKSEKLSSEGQALVNSLRANAKISYFVEY